MLAVAILTGISFLVSAGCVSFVRNWNPWTTRETQKPKPPPAQSKSSSTEEKALKRPKIPDLAQPGDKEAEGSRSSIKVSPERVESAAAKTEKTDGTTGKTEPAASTVESDEKMDKKEAFKKHDHVAYVERIKDKANELIKKQSDCTLARLCRHTVTDEWTLQVYVRHPNAFTFVVYSWDEIDEKWEKSYASENRPTTQWEHHLRFSAASKECSVLKGNQR